MSDSRVGVFICDCGQEISGVLDVPLLESRVGEVRSVVFVRRLRYGCSPDGLSAIQGAIREHGLERVVVAGCTPRTLAPRFQGICQEAGLGREDFDLVDIREGCAWVHASEPQAALAKALDLIRMGVAKIASQTRCTEVTARVVRAVLVIGGGLAGLTAAETLGRMDVPVTVVERESALGGMLRRVHVLWPGGGDASELLRRKIEAVAAQRSVEVLLNSQVTAVSGTPGCYRVTVTRGGPCEQSSKTLEVGAIIVATGGRLAPVPKSLGYDGHQVVTQQEFAQKLCQTAGGSAVGDPHPIVMLPCTEQQYRSDGRCSELCCSVALQQAVQTKAAGSDLEVTVLLPQGCLAEGARYQSLLTKAQQAGVQVLRYPAALPPMVRNGVVLLEDTLTGKTKVVPYGRLVVGQPVVPQPDASRVAHMLHLAQDEQGFFPQVRYRLRPQYYVERGIYVCGAAHYPTDWRDTEFQAVGAAFDAWRQIQAEKVISLAPIATVEDSLCTGCGNCVTSCAFAAITMKKREGVLDLAVVDPLLCVGCGNCVVTCPSKAVSLSGSSDMQVLAQMEEALADKAEGSYRILLLGCEWSGYATAELAGARRLSYPSTIRPIRLRCSARCDPLHILWAFLNGADGVFLGACPPGDCHYLTGNQYAQERIESLRALLASAGFDPRRLRLEWITPDDPQEFVDKITSFAQLVEALG